MSGFEEVARVEAVVGADLTAMLAAYTAGEARTKTFAAATEASLERAERSAEDFSRSSAAAMGRAGAAHQAAAAKAVSASAQQSAAMQRAASASEAAATRVAAANASAGVSFTSMATRAERAAKTAALGLAAGAVVGTAAIIKTGMAFDAQMSRVRAVSGSTQAEFDAMRGAAIRFGADSVFSATEAAEGMEILGAAGLDSSAIIKAMPGLLDGAASSGEDFAKTASILTASLGAFNLDADKSTHIMDVLAAAAMASDASIGSLGGSLKFAAPTANAFGMSIEETAAVLTLFAEAGIKGSRGGTALNASLLQLADGRGASGKMMKELGLSIEGANGKIKPFSKVIDELSVSMEGMGKAEKLSTMSALFGQEAAPAMLKVLGDGRKRVDELTESFVKADGAAATMAATMTDNLAGDVEQLKGALESAAIAVSDAFRPVLRDKVQEFQVYVNSDEFVEDAQAVVGAVVAVGGAMADTAAFVHEHRKAILLLGAAYVGLRAASAGASLLGGLAGRGAARGAGMAGAAVEAGTAAAVAGPKLVTFAKYAATAARGLTLLGVGTIAAQALYSLASSGDDAGASAEGAAGRIASLQSQIDKMPVRKVTEVVVKTTRVDGEGGGKPTPKPNPAAGLGVGVNVGANRDVVLGAVKEQEAAQDRLASAVKRRADAEAAAGAASARLGGTSLRLENERQRLMDAGLSSIETEQHPAIEGLVKLLDEQAAAAKKANQEVAKSGDAFAEAEQNAKAADRVVQSLYRKLAGIGAGVKPMVAKGLIEDMSEAERVAVFGTTSVNAALKKMGFVNVSGRWFDSLSQKGAMGKAIAAEIKSQSNTILAGIGGTSTSSGFLGSMEVTRARALEIARSITAQANAILARIGDSVGGGGVDDGGGVAAGRSAGAIDKDGPEGRSARGIDKGGSEAEWLSRAARRPKRVGARRSAALTRAMRQAAIDANPAAKVTQATQQYNAALAATRGKSGQKLKDARALLAERAEALVGARGALRDDRASKLAERRDVDGARLMDVDSKFVGVDAANRQSSLIARGTAGLGDDIASVDAQRGATQSRIDELRARINGPMNLGAAKNKEVRADLTAQLNAAIEQQIGLDQERNGLIAEQNAATRQAELDRPRSMMVLVDAETDLAMAMAEATAGVDDDNAVRARALADEMKRQQALNALLENDKVHQDLTEAEKADLTGQLAASVRTTTSLTQAMEEATRAANEATMSAELDRAQRERDAAIENARLSEAALGVLSGPGDMGYAGGANAWQSARGAQPVTVHVHSMTGYSPEIREVVGDAAGGGFTQGGNAYRSYSGRD